MPAPVVETLNRLVPILNDLGVDTSWEVTIGGADFDTVTRSVGRALAGTEQVITEGMLERLRDTCADNARRLRLDADLVVVHDAGRSCSSGQPRRRGALGVGAPRRSLVAADPALDRAPARRPSATTRRSSPCRSSPPPLSIPRFVIHPSIDPLSERNREMTRGEQTLQLDRLHVPRDKPILLQVGPFERVGDPARRRQRVPPREEAPRRAARARGPAADAGRRRRRSARCRRRPPAIPTCRVIVLPPDPQTELNALERAAAIVVHKPLETDFGIDVAAAMWKGKPVVGSAAGGIPFQIPQAVTGYVVETWRAPRSASATC